MIKLLDYQIKCVNFIYLFIIMELQDNKLKLFSLAFHEDNKNLLARNGDMN